MILGLTGFSGAGKSTVAQIFKEHGFYHLDCDNIVHERVYRDPTVLNVLAEEFGKEIIADGALNRPILRKYTMGKPEALDRLNRLVMPFILSAIHADLAAHKDQHIVLDAPLLFESGLDQKCDCVLSVVADPKAAAERIILRDHLQPTDAEKRLSSQHSAEYYIEKSDYILQNNGDLNTLHQETIHLIKIILGEHQ
ncbi:MAG: dephospho-CoA kinase [Clostridia bacterium]|nr:dephospho-CoA kinase [Clostridia bacterium]